MTRFRATLTLLTCLAVPAATTLAEDAPKKTSDPRKPSAKETSAFSDKSISDLIDRAADLREAIEKGDLSKEDAIAKFRAHLRKLRNLDRATAKQPIDLKQLGARLKSAVADGKLTEAEARAKWQLASKQGKGKQGKGKRVAKQRKGKRDAKRGVEKDLGTKENPNLDKIWADLQAAVKAGKMTQRVAESKMAGIKRSLQPARNRKPFIPLDAGATVEQQPAGGLTTPPAADAREGSDSTLIFGWAANATHRFMDNTHQGKPRVISAVSFRLDQRAHDALGRTWSNVTVRIAHGDWQSIQYNKSQEFTLADKSVKVFDREWSFPAVKGRPPLTPASWGGLKNSLTFRFAKPWHYNGKDAIFLEFKFSGGTAHNGKPWVGQTPKGFEYYLDSMPEDGGWRKVRTATSINYEASIVPAATSYAAGGSPTDLSVWTAAAKGMPFIHYHN